MLRSHSLDLIVQYSFPSFVYPTAAKRHLCCSSGETDKTDRRVAGSAYSWGKRGHKVSSCMPYN